MLPEPKIRNLRMAGESPSPGGFQKVATFDVELDPSVTLHGFRLVRTPTGRLQPYPPDRRDGAGCASLAPALRDRIADLAALNLESSIAPTSETI